MSANSQKGSALRALTDSLRARGGVEYGTGKLAIALPGRGEVLEWKDYVRGKDLSRYLKGKQELLDSCTKPQGPGRTQDDQVSDLVCQLMSKRLLLPAQRKFKKPKPGKKKLVKWPRTLEQADLEWSEELFYAFSYEQPRGALFYLGAVFVVVAVLGVTLFPLAPYPVRLAVLYALSGVLGVLLGTMLLRYVVWGAVWLASGAHFWLLPNMMSEELPITELFSPIITYTAAEPGDRCSSLLLRGGAALLLAGAGYGLWAVGPDAATVKANVEGARDSVLNYFDLIDSMKAGLTNGTNTTGIELNTTTSSSSSSKTGGSSSSSSGSSAQQQQGGAGGSSSAGHGGAAAGGKGGVAEEEWDPTKLDSDEAEL